SSAIISRNRSGPNAAAISIEWTTSANSTVTCLYSADPVTCATGAPHSLQNLAVAFNCTPHDPQHSPIAVSPPPPSSLRSTSTSCHCWLALSINSLDLAAGRNLVTDGYCPADHGVVGHP